MTDEAEGKDKPETKAVKVLARVLHGLATKGVSENDADGEDEAGFTASKKEYIKKARYVVRRLEKKGVKFVTE